MFLLERLQLRTNRAKVSQGRLDRLIVPLAIGGGAAVGLASGRKGEDFLNPTAVNAMTAATLLGGGAYLLGRKPYGLPWAREPGALQDIYMKGMQAGVAGGLASVPAWAAGRAFRQRE